MDGYGTIYAQRQTRTPVKSVYIGQGDYCQQSRIMEALFPCSSEEDEKIDYNTVQYVVQNIATGKMHWDLERIDGDTCERIDYIIDQLLVNADYNLIDAFLISHRLFTTTIELIDKLLLRFAQILDESWTSDTVEQYGKVRVYAVIQRWLQSPYTSSDLETHKSYFRIRLESLKESLIDAVELQMVDSLLGKIDCISRHNSVDNSDSASIKSNSSMGHKWRNMFSRSRTSTGDSNTPTSPFDSMNSLDSMLSVYSGAHFLLSNTTESLAEALYVIEMRSLLALDWKELIEFPIIDSSPKGTVKNAVEHFNLVPKLSYLWSSLAGGLCSVSWTSIKDLKKRLENWFVFLMYPLII